MNYTQAELTAQVPSRVQSDCFEFLIQSMGDQGFLVVEPFMALVHRDYDHCYVASIQGLDIGARGPTLYDAIERLKDAIAVVYEALEGIAEWDLTPMAMRDLERLQRHIRRYQT